MKVLNILLLCLVLFNYTFASEFESLTIESSHASSIINEDVQHDDFGSSISSFESTIAVGAPLRTQSGVMSGAVYVFEKNARHSWRLVVKLDDHDALNLGSFVELNGYWLAATGQSFKHGATAVYIFHKVDNRWVQWQVLTGNNPDPKNFFGCDVKIQNNIMVIGAYGENDNTGAAYFYELVNEKWEMIQRVASEVAPESYFGNYVALDGDTAIVSSWGTTVNDMAKAGSAHVFKRSIDGEWSETQTLVSPEGYYFQKFGNKCLALRDNMAMVCASSSDIDNFTEAGAVFTFSYEQGSWIASQRLSPCDPFCYENYHFGSTLGLSKDFVIIGADLKNNDRRDMFMYKKNSTGDWERLYHLTTSDINKREGFLQVSLNEDGLISVGTLNHLSRGSVHTLSLRCLREGKDCNLPCKKPCNNGLCERSLTGTENCVCQEGFSGELCDIPIVDLKEHQEVVEVIPILTKEPTNERPTDKEPKVPNEERHEQNEEPKHEPKNEPTHTEKKPQEHFVTKSQPHNNNKTNEQIKQIETTPKTTPETTPETILETIPHDDHLNTNHTEDKLQHSEHNDVEITGVRKTSIALILVFVAIMIGVFLAIYIKRNVFFKKVESELPSLKTEGEIVFNEESSI